MTDIDNYTPRSGRMIKEDGTIVNEANLLTDIADGLGSAGMTTLATAMDNLTTEVASAEVDIETLNSEMAPWAFSKCYQCAVPSTGTTKVLTTAAQVVLFVNDSAEDPVYVAHEADNSAVAPTEPSAPSSTVEEIPQKILPGEILPVIETGGVGSFGLVAPAGKTVTVRVLAYWK